MRQRRVKNRIIELMKEEGQMSTREIYLILNIITHHGISMNQLGNVLSKGKEFEKVGFINESNHGDRNRSIVWRLKDANNTEIQM